MFFFCSLSFSLVEITPLTVTLKKALGEVGVLARKTLALMTFPIKGPVPRLCQQRGRGAFFRGWFTESYSSA